MTWALVLLGFVVGLVVGYLVVSRKPKKDRYLAVCEYWVYLPGEQMPPQDGMLDRMVGKNPYRQKGKDPIGPSEGIILSDVRLHIALVLRRRNPHVFRPDLFEDVVLDDRHLAELAESNSLVKIRYVSEEPLKDKRHLQFLIHAADAMAELGGSTLIYDSTAQRIYLKEDLQRALAADPDGTRVDLQVRTVWNETPTSCSAETRGLRKIGLDELRTGAMEKDEKVLVTQVLDLAIDRLWNMAALPEELEVEAYGDTFKLLIQEAKEGFAPTRILRVHTA